MHQQVHLLAGGPFSNTVQTFPRAAAASRCSTNRDRGSISVVHTSRSVLSGCRLLDGDAHRCARPREAQRLVEVRCTSSASPVVSHSPYTDANPREYSSVPARLTRAPRSGTGRDRSRRPAASGCRARAVVDDAVEREGLAGLRAAGVEVVDAHRVAVNRTTSGGRWDCGAGDAMRPQEQSEQEEAHDAFSIIFRRAKTCRAHYRRRRRDRPRADRAAVRAVGERGDRDARLRRLDPTIAALVDREITGSILDRPLLERFLPSIRSSWCSTSRRCSPPARSSRRCRRTRSTSRARSTCSNSRSTRPNRTATRSSSCIRRRLRPTGCRASTKRSASGASGRTMARIRRRCTGATSCIASSSGTTTRGLQAAGGRTGERARGFPLRAVPGADFGGDVPSGGTSDYAPEMIHAAARGEPYECLRPARRAHSVHGDARRRRRAAAAGGRAARGADTHRLQRRRLQPVRRRRAPRCRCAPFPTPTSHGRSTRSVRASSTPGPPTSTTAPPGATGASPRATTSSVRSRTT